MPSVAEVDVLITGDVGGKGISRFRFETNTGAPPLPADCNSVGAALRAFYFSMAGWLPTVCSVAVQGLVNVYDETTGLVSSPVQMSTVPGPVSGGGAGNYAAGMGLRVNWKTNVIVGRRLIKGSTFMVPLVSSAFTANGSPASSVTATLASAAATYISSTTGANTVPVIWHRPPKGTHAGGAAGHVVGSVVGTTPAGLRSRRA